MKTATCHPDRPHYAKGKCRACYQSEYHKVYDKQRFSRFVYGDPELAEAMAANPHESLFRYNVKRPFGVHAELIGGYLHNGKWRHM